MKPKLDSLLEKNGAKKILGFIADQDEGTYLSQIARSLNFHINTVWRDLRKMQEYQGEDPQDRIIEIEEDGGKLKVIRATPQGVRLVQKIRKEGSGMVVRTREGEGTAPKLGKDEMKENAEKYWTGRYSQNVYKDENGESNSGQIEKPSEVKN